MKNVLIIQARMQSSRLPGKVLLPLREKPMLDWVVSRASGSAVIDTCMVATTDDSADDPIENYCSAHHVPVYRGSQYDVLDRYYHAAKNAEADTIIRVTADCPLIDPSLIDQLYHFYVREQADFAANRLPPPWHRTYPIGLDAEIVSMKMLERAWKEAEEKFEREHVMPWFYDTEGRCKTAIMDNDVDYGSHRWTVDTPEDYQMMQALFEQLPDPLHNSWLDVLDIIKKHPELELINAQSKAKNVKTIDTRS
ncbi:MAG: glycosyltransferase family protein [Anaerolineaceae bacterium]|nr:glycosyltransferase family protein [Anaerolineaceae bacterium]